MTMATAHPHAALEDTTREKEGTSPAPTCASRMVALLLRNYRAERGLPPHEVAPQAGLSARQLARIECGEERPDPAVLDRLLSLYARLAGRQAIYDFLHGGDQSPPCAALDRAPGWPDRLSTVERYTTLDLHYSGAFPPPDLQTPAYRSAVRALLPSMPVDLAPLPAGCTVLLDEMILRRPVGSPATTAHQLDHLAKTIKAGGDIRIIPSDRPYWPMSNGYVARRKLAGHPLITEVRHDGVCYIDGPDGTLLARLLTRTLTQAEPPERSHQMLTERSRQLLVVANDDHNQRAKG